MLTICALMKSFSSATASTAAKEVLALSPNSNSPFVFTSAARAFSMSGSLIFFKNCAACPLLALTASRI